MRFKKENYWKLIHQLLIEGRLLAAKLQDPSLMATYFDDLEYLVSLIIHNEERTMVFREYYIGFCKQFQLLHLVSRVDEL